MSANGHAETMAAEKTDFEQKSIPSVVVTCCSQAHGHATSEKAETTSGLRGPNSKEIQDISSDAEDERDVCIPGRPLESCYHSFRRASPELMSGFREVVCGTKLCLLLFAIPLTFLADELDLGRGWVFGSSLIAIAPLAERLGFVTEQLAYYTGPTAGGLLNATFGNATELIISIFALQHNMIRVVQLTLLGSILSNMLLVLGCSFLFGGLSHPKNDHQKFNKATAMVSTSLLLMAVMGLLFPAVLHATGTELNNSSSEITLSRFVSCVMIMAYGCYLYFQLKSHKQMYESSGDDDALCDDEDHVLGFWSAIFWLGVLTVFISILSQILVDAIQGAAETWKIPVAFLSVIILPLVGNAAEHGSAIVFAVKDKLDISLGVAIGSSTQIAMFVIPFCVLIAWATGVDMDLNFEIFETATLFITVLVVSVMVQDGTSNYFKGLMLILCYIMVGASFWVHVDVTPDNHGLAFTRTLLHKVVCMFSRDHCVTVQPTDIVAGSDMPYTNRSR